jgi:Flp pilus assembly protein TadD
MLEKGDTKAAIQDLETAVRLQPSAAYSYYQLSLAYRRDGRVEEAQQTLKKYQALHDNIPRPEAKN